MIKLKKYFIITMFSTGIGTTLSVAIYLLFVRGSFNLLQPFAIRLSNPIYNATISILIYCAFGIAVYSASELFKEYDRAVNHNVYRVIGSFFMSVTIFSVLEMLSIYPISESFYQVKDIYISEIGINSFILHFFLVPVFECFTIYLIVYIVLWLFYHRQVSKLNKILKNSKY